MLQLDNAKEAYKAGNYLEAIEWAQKVPSNVQAHTIIAKSAFSLQDFKRSSVAYEAALKLDPNLPLLWKGVLEVGRASKDLDLQMFALDGWANLMHRKGKIERYLSILHDKAELLEENEMLFSCLKAWLDTEKVRSTFYGSYKVVYLLEKQKKSLNEEVQKLLKSMRKFRRRLLDLAALESWSATSSNKALYDVVQRAIEEEISLQLDDLDLCSSIEKRRLLETLKSFCIETARWFPFTEKPLEVLLFFAQLKGQVPQLHKLEYLSLLRTYFPQNGNVLLQDGVIAEAQGNIKQAKNSLEIALKCNPDNASGWSTLASIFLRKSDHFDPAASLNCVSKSRDVVKRMKSKFHLPFENEEELMLNLLRNEAQAQVELKHTERAFLLFEECLKLKPLHTETLVMYAESLSSAKDYDRARSVAQLLDESIKKRHLVLGGIELACENFHKAQHHLELYIKLDPLNAAGATRLGCTYYRLGNKWKIDRNFCLHQLVHAVKLDPSSRHAFRYLGLWYRDVGNDINRAEKCFVKALVYDLADSDSGIALSEIYENRKDFLRAVELWKKVGLKNPPAKWALLRLAQFQLLRSEKDCLNSLHKAVRHNSLDGRCWAALGFAYLHYNKHISAYKALCRAVELGVVGDAIQCELARLQYMQGDFPGAKTRLEESMTVSSLYCLADMYYAVAQHRQSNGYVGLALKAVYSGIAAISKCIELRAGATECAFKLLGDLQCYVFHLFMSKEAENLIPMISAGTNAYKKAVEINPKCAMNQYDVGISLLYQHKAQLSSDGNSKSAGILQLKSDETLRLEAYSFFRQALRLDPGDPSIWNALAISDSCYIRRHFALSQSCSKSSEHAWSNLLLLYLEFEELDMARQALEALQNVSNNDSVFVWLGHGVLKKLEADNSIGWFNDFECALDTSFQMECCISFCEACVAHGDTLVPAALLFSRLAIERDTKNLFVMHLCAVILEKSCLLQESQEMYKYAYDLINDITTGCNANTSAMDSVRSNYGFCCMKTGNVERALSLFKEVEHPKLVDRLGIFQALFLMNRKNDSLNELSSIISEYSTSALYGPEITQDLSTLRIKLSLALCEKAKGNTATNIRTLKQKHPDSTYLRRLELLFSCSEGEDSGLIEQMRHDNTLESMDCLKMYYEKLNNASDALSVYASTMMQFPLQSNVWNFLLQRLLFAATIGGDVLSISPNYYQSSVGNKSAKALNLQFVCDLLLRDTELLETQHVVQTSILSYPCDKMYRFMLICTVAKRCVLGQGDLEDFEIVVQAVNCVTAFDDKDRALDSLARKLYEHQQNIHLGNVSDLGQLLQEAHECSTNKMYIKEEALLRLALSNALVQPRESSLLFILLRLVRVWVCLGDAKRAAKLVKRHAVGNREGTTITCLQFVSTLRAAGKVVLCSM